VPPPTREQLFEVALFHAQRGDFFRAEQYLVASRLHGHEDEATTYWLVRICVSAGRYHAALRHAREHLRRNPGNWRLRLVVASIHEALGEADEARRQLDGVVQTAPGRALPHYRIGMLDGASRENRERARAHLERYLALAPEGAHADEARAALQRWDADDAMARSDSEATP
jgi:Flp pilus assembly protein TadD